MTTGKMVTVTLGTYYSDATTTVRVYADRRVISRRQRRDAERRLGCGDGDAARILSASDVSERGGDCGVYFGDC